MQSYPNYFLIPLGQVGNRGETYFGTDCGEEDMLVLNGGFLAVLGGQTMVSGTRSSCSSR